MWDLLRKYRVYVAVGVVLLAAFVFYSLNLKNKEHANAFESGVLNLMAPVAGVVAGMNRGVTGVWSDYVDLLEVRKENKQLRESVRILNSRLLDAGEAILANERLRKLLELKTSLRAPSLAASVIGEDDSPWFKTIVIDRGTADGLREGLPVVASDGVVGQLVKVTAGSSRVLLLTDHASGIAGAVQRSRARGVVKGMGGGRCSLDFTLREEDVKVGDTVITSGIGGVFPKGLPVGEVTMVKKGGAGIFQTVELRPRVNIPRLEEVLVILQEIHD
ncbi:MAG TPA: rod shape-determining protein MreC [Geobacteraceae bacterium]|nr:rod shape-determining protein MreC [Geobacteraceae bacterium]